MGLNIQATPESALNGQQEQNCPWQQALATMDITALTHELSRRGALTQKDVRTSLLRSEAWEHFLTHIKNYPVREEEHHRQTLISWFLDFVLIPFLKEEARLNPRLLNVHWGSFLQATGLFEDLKFDQLLSAKEYEGLISFQPHEEEMVNFFEKSAHPHDFAEFLNAILKLYKLDHLSVSPSLSESHSINIALYLIKSIFATIKNPLKVIETMCHYIGAQDPLEQLVIKSSNSIPDQHIPSFVDVFCEKMRDQSLTSNDLRAILRILERRNVPDDAKEKLLVLMNKGLPSDLLMDKELFSHFLAFFVAQNMEKPLVENIFDLIGTFRYYDPYLHTQLSNFCTSKADALLEYYHKALKENDERRIAAARSLVQYLAFDDKATSSQIKNIVNLIEAESVDADSKENRPEETETNIRACQSLMHVLQDIAGAQSPAMDKPLKTEITPFLIKICSKYSLKHELSRFIISFDLNKEEIKDWCHRIRAFKREFPGLRGYLPFWALKRVGLLSVDLIKELDLTSEEVVYLFKVYLVGDLNSVSMMKDFAQMFPAEYDQAYNEKIQEYNVRNDDVPAHYGFHYLSAVDPKQTLQDVKAVFSDSIHRTKSLIYPYLESNFATDLVDIVDNLKKDLGDGHLSWMEQRFFGPSWDGEEAYLELAHVLFKNKLSYFSQVFTDWGSKNFVGFVEQNHEFFTNDQKAIVIQQIEKKEWLDQLTSEQYEKAKKVCAILKDDTMSR